MKKIVILSLLAVFATGSFAKKPKQEVVQPKQEVVQESQPLKPVTVIETVSYALGADFGENLSQNAKQFNIEIDWEFLKLGLSETVTGKSQLSKDEMMNAFTQLNSIVAESQKAKALEQKTFLENNKNAAGVKVTESGLQYKILTLGKGAKPTAADQVKVHYHGTLIDGTVFDSSVDRGDPITFPLSGVIAGWTEGVQLMPVGSKFVFYIPSELGYGDQGAPGGAIPPGSTLIFEVELLDINPK